MCSVIGLGMPIVLRPPWHGQKNDDADGRFVMKMSDDFGGEAGSRGNLAPAPN